MAPNICSFNNSLMGGDNCILRYLVDVPVFTQFGPKVDIEYIAFSIKHCEHIGNTIPAVD